MYTTNDEAKPLFQFLVEPLWPTGNENNITGLDGEALFIDTSYWPEDHKITEGIVISAPKAVMVDCFSYMKWEHTPESPAEIGEKFKKGDMKYFQHGISEGDIVGFHPNTLSAEDIKAGALKEGMYVAISYNSIRYVRQEECVIPTRGYTICDRVNLSEHEDGLMRSPSGLIASVEKKYDKNRFSVRFSSRHDLKEGDIVYPDMKKSGATPIKILGEDLVCVANNMMLAKEEANEVL